MDEFAELLGMYTIPYEHYVIAGDLNIHAESESPSAKQLKELLEMYDLQQLKDMGEAELVRQLKKETMVEFLSLGDIFRANKIFEAALKMTKASMTWLRNQV